MATGVENLYIQRGGKSLRCGYTTGSCAAAAAKAAAFMLLSGERVTESRIVTPKGIRLCLEILDTQAEDGCVSCAVRKDGGDDPDATNGLLVRAAVRRLDAEFGKAVMPAGGSGTGSGTDVTGSDEESEAASPTDGNNETQTICRAGENGQTEDCLPSHPHAFVHRAEEFVIFLDGGEGVGRVTRRGLKQQIGEVAINPVPQQMIFEGVEAVCRETHFRGGLFVEISIPDGRETARRTFNPRLGIEGGLSVLGTTGIVEPMSEKALTASIALEMDTLAAAGFRDLLTVPGNYGETFAEETLGLAGVRALQCSNYVGETLDMAAQRGIRSLLFVAHIGKFIKVAGGIMNTHSRDADCRAELCAAFALKCGADAETARRILETQTTDEALEIMEQAGVLESAMALAAERIRYYLAHRTGGRVRAEAILFNTVHGLLAKTEGADELLEAIRAQGAPADG